MAFFDAMENDGFSDPEEYMAYLEREALDFFYESDSSRFDLEDDQDDSDYEDYDE